MAGVPLYETEGRELGGIPGNRYSLKDIVVTPHARFVTSSDCYKEYHSMTILNTANITLKKGQRKIIPKFITLGCDNMDDSGYCLGHQIKREEFIQKWCAGIEPPQLNNQKGEAKCSGQNVEEI